MEHDVTEGNSTAPELDVAIKYRILTYALREDWHTWVCAVQATKKGVCLRFLYGVLLDDPRGVLRSGTSVLKTWDLGFDDVVDPAAVGAYVTEAVGRYGEYKANTQEVLNARQGSSQGKATTEGRRLTAESSDRGCR
jgi:hypothetical protein